jgi:hypothetical protein
MDVVISNAVLNDLKSATSLIWFETNQKRALSSGTVSGALTSQFQSLLKVPLANGQMHSFLAKMEENLISGDEKACLSTNFYPGTIFPEGYQHLETFEKKIYPEFVYKIGRRTLLKKKLILAWDSNQLIVLYELLESPGPIDLELIPLFADRQQKQLTKAGFAGHHLYAAIENGNWQYRMQENAPYTFVHMPNARFEHQPDWYYRFQYPGNQVLGELGEEDLFSPGKFVCTLKQGESIGMVIGDVPCQGQQPEMLFQAELNRRMQEVASKRYMNGHQFALNITLNQLIRQNTDGTLEITNVCHALENLSDQLTAAVGMLLLNRKFQAFQDLLLQARAKIKAGLVAAEGKHTIHEDLLALILWYANGSYKYVQYAEDLRYMKEVAMPDLVDHIQALAEKHEDGHLFIEPSPKADLFKTDTYYQALWFNMLRITTYFLRLNSLDDMADQCDDLAVKVKNELTTTFKELFDQNLVKNKQNQVVSSDLVFALSLPYPAITGPLAVKSLEAIRNQLLTPSGLFHTKPDNSFSNSIIYTWPMILYIESLMKHIRNEGPLMGKRLFSTFLQNLMKGILGTLPNAWEDGYPLRIAGETQVSARSLAELFRVGIEYDLFDEESQQENIFYEQSNLGKQTRTYKNPFSQRPAFRGPTGKGYPSHS